MYRTKTYIAAEWSGDSDAVKQLRTWNENEYLNLSFTDAHDITQARDGSLNCSIKSSLSVRLNAAKTFILIVGDNTKTVRSGSCQYCKSNNSYGNYCVKGYNVDYRSFIEYECEKAIRDKIKIVVLYNATTIDRSKCPEIIKYVGKHVAMCKYKARELYWDYQAVKNAIS